MPLKLFLYILSSLFFLSFSYPLQEKEKEDIDGSIKSIIVSTYKMENNLNQIEKENFHSKQIYKYDR